MLLPILLHYYLFKLCLHRGDYAGKSNVLRVIFRDKILQFLCVKKRGYKNVCN